MAYRETQEDQDSSDPDIDEIVEEYKETVRVRRWRNRQNTNGGSRPSLVTSLRATWAMCAYTCFLTCLCVLLNYAKSQIRIGDIASTFFLCTFILLVLVSLAFLLRQPRDSTSLNDVILKCPVMPYTGLVTLTLQIFLATKMTPWIWAALVLWMIPGTYYDLESILSLKLDPSGAFPLRMKNQNF